MSDLTKKIKGLVLIFFLVFGPLSLMSCGGGDGVAVILDAISRLSVHTDGSEANGSSATPSISSNGRYVAFASYASNLVTVDANGATQDIFLRDELLGTTTLISLDTGGNDSNASSSAPDISANGQYVAFYSTASDLVANDTNGFGDIFVRDTQGNTTIRVSVHTDGTQGNNWSSSAAISEDGQYVAFDSNASNLIAADANGATTDVFIRDTVNSTTTLISEHTDGTQGNSTSFYTAINPDGRYVVFASFASNLVNGDVNNLSDIFLRDTQNDTTTLVSVHTDGTQGNNDSGSTSKSAISSDGRYVAFESDASTLVNGDVNNRTDIFLRDTLNDITTLLSVHTDGTQGNFDSTVPSISSNGRYVAFQSNSSTLVTGDGNVDRDIFVRDTLTNTTIRVNVDSSGTEGNQASGEPNISDNGYYVAFDSWASNLVAGDVNNIFDIFRAPNE